MRVSWLCCFMGLMLSAGVHADQFVSAATGFEDDCFPKKPLAWCLMDLVEASAGLSILSKDQAPQYLHQGGRELEMISASGSVVPIRAQLGAISEMMGIAAVKRNTLQPMPGETNGGLVLVPKSEVNGDLRELITKTYTEAAIAAMGAEKAEWIKEKKARGYFRLTGGACRNKYCDFRMMFAGGKSPKFYKEAAMPAYLDASKSPAYISTDFDKFGVNLQINFQNAGLPVYVNMSRLLPKWAYLYLTPMGQIENEGVPATLVPVLLNQGEALLLIEPALNAPERIASDMVKH